MNNDNETMIKEKVNTFFELDFAVHISLNNKDWRNGKIISISDTYFLLSENLLGEIPIFFSDIYEISKLTEVKE